MTLQFNELTEHYAVSEPVDLSNGVTIKFERDDGVITGLVWDHGCTAVPGVSGIAFDIPENSHVPAEAKWQVESLDPLTVSPSLLCGVCGKHGFIRNGRWEPC